MKFTLSCTELASHLQAIGKVISTKNKISILDCFLFEVKGLVLTITASDSENTLITSVELAEASDDGRFAINAKTIQDALKGIPEQPITFEINAANYETKLIYQNGFFSLVCQNADEYPSNTEPALEAGKITVDANVLSESLTRALLAVAEDNIRPVMTGVYFDITEKNATVVASDGRKLVYTRWNNTESAKAMSFILPHKPAQLLKCMLAKESGDVVERFDEQRAEVEMKAFHMSCRLIEGRFPNYNSVIPTNNPNSVNVNRVALINALRRVMVFSDEVSSLVKLHLEANKLTISVQNLDYSLSAEESMLCEYDGIPMNIGLRSTTLVELLNNLQSEEVAFHLADQSRAAIIVPAPQPENLEIVMLLMPIMLNE